MARSILITNDDGIHAPALAALERGLKHLGRIWVVAPDREMSAQSHAITLNRPLRYHGAGPGRFAVDGTPADCVILACLRILDRKPDLLVSGINRGRNVGDSVLYSGTIAAASEGALQGIPSIAVSQEYSDRMDYTLAAELTAVIAHRVVEDGLPHGVVLNLNVPVGWNGGVVLTRQGEKAGKTVLVENLDPRGEEYYWLHEEFHGDDARGAPAELPTDGEVLAEGAASLTPLQLDRTAFRSVKTLSGWTEILTGTRFERAD
jgi:5'-nucleotidase